jgi:cytochrome c551/c552
MRRETTEVLGSGLLLAALVLASIGALAPAQGASASVPTTAVAAASSQVERGRTLFYAKGCVGCHKKQGEAGEVSVGPDLTGLAVRAGHRKPGMSAEDYVYESIKTPSAFVVPDFAGLTPFGMPDLGLSDAEIDALTVFLLGTP